MAMRNEARRFLGCQPSVNNQTEIISMDRLSPNHKRAATAMGSRARKMVESAYQGGYGNGKTKT